jgi:peptidyl-prolyl cis-trans isomerase A (cyclophilin A)/peptidyl-prolyl cis-trans isomerase B (cyclophilin B)
MDVVNKIAAVKTGYRLPYSDVPVTPVVIESAKILEPAVKPAKK